MNKIFFKDKRGALRELLPVLNGLLQEFNAATLGRIPMSDEYNALAEAFETLAGAIVINSREAERARNECLNTARSMRLHARERWAAGL